VSTGWRIARIDELESFDVAEGGLTWRPVRRHFDIRAFGVNAYTAERAGQRVVEEHRESGGHEELYVVLTGRATFELDGEEHDAPAGTLVHCLPGTKRGAVAAEPGTTVLGIGARPGEAYVPSPWEHSFVAVGRQRAGDFEGARAEMTLAVSEHPDAWQGWFNFACLEALAGDREKALDYLERAAGIEPGEVARLAREDSDFDSLRDDPRYLAVAGQADAGGDRS
jgi:quercetin dioxygenase-like cupin family protein